jgi:hypothetical protein
MARPRTGSAAVMVIRLWFESDGDRPAFRARLTWTPDVVEPGRSLVVTTVDEMLAHVAAWSRKVEGRVRDTQT